MSDKVEAIFELREAAEEHARAEVQLEVRDTPQARDHLLDARIELENKTYDAIAACHKCGESHAPHGSCNVIQFPSRSQADSQSR